MTNWCLDFSTSFMNYEFISTDITESECSVMEAFVIVKGWKDSHDAGLVVACLLFGLDRYWQVLYRPVSPLQMALGFCVTTNVCWCWLEWNAGAALEPGGSLLEHTWPNIRPGVGIKSGKCALCRRRFVTLRLLGRKGIMSLLYTVSMTSCREAELYDKHYSVQFSEPCSPLLKISDSWINLYGHAGLMWFPFA